MIIIDFSQLVIAGYMAAAYNNGAYEDPDEDFVRHISLNSIRLHNSRFRRQYGQLVLAVDSPKGSWRRSIFPYYKKTRADNRKKSAVNWELLHRNIRLIKEELIAHFPYKVIESDYAEADDIIGVLTRHVSEYEDVLIISSDGDFIQLQIDRPNVHQYDHRLDRYLSAENPRKYLFEHILQGDRGDGIPNILSPEDSFVTKTRQKPLSQKKKEEYWADPSVLKGDPRFTKNVQLIDLKFTPKHIQEDIIKKFEEYKPAPRVSLQEYFIKHRMRLLYENIGDF